MHDPRHPARNLYRSPCAACASEVAPHQGVLAGGPGRWQTWCSACWPQRDRSGPTALVRAWERGGPVEPGYVVRADRALPAAEREGVADWLTVIASERHRDYDDDAECWSYSWAWVCREAEPGEGEEARACWQREQDELAAKRSALDLWRALREVLDRSGTDTPPGRLSHPQGDDRVEAYGGGWGRQDEAVLVEDRGEGGWLWYLAYNGRDGDDWSRNNVGGHSIAHRYPLTPEIRTAYHAAAVVQRAARGDW